MSNYALLPERAVLAVSGEDAAAFLQGLISNDIHKAGEGIAIFAALLSPQGKFLHDFFISKQAERFYLETEKARLPDLKKRLSMYKLRSKVEFAEPGLSVAAVWNENRHPEPQVKDLAPTAEILRSALDDGYMDPRLPELGARVVVHEIPAFAGMTLANYDLHRLSLGVPGGSKDMIPDRSLLLEYGYDELHGVDFAKGCYVGQEVTARSKHRATLRKFIHQVTAENALPPFGTPVMQGEREIGTMASSNGNVGLALLRVEEVKKGGLTSGGAALAARLPSWCMTQFEQDNK